ncbi:MAG: GTP-binding protein TypA [Parcubacteria group bacterium GW2011_GWA2_52_8]|nr:MAG: GTP-binding protein TypA [Parcubacteria group bacterium GW2011_GWA2_52_8]
MEIRNIAIIAHVDHGKTTLTDALMRQAGVAVEGVSMDSNTLELERGITIYSKNASITYKGTKINIVDTPGHADFGSEVERVLRSIDSVLLVVDAQEGPMPQTRFVLKKSLELGLSPIVLINKIDKPAADPKRCEELVLELFLELGANDRQADLLAGRALRFQPFNLGYDNYLGRLAVGRVHEGVLKSGQQVFVKKPDGETRTGKVTKIFTFRGLEKIESEEAGAGDIVMIAGLPDIYIGETVAAKENAEALPAIAVDEPTIALTFLINNSPFGGREGKFVTSRQLREYLARELEVNVGLRIDFSNDSFRVYGRGELHIAILLENMRRAGYEVQVSQPQVIIREENGKKLEPFEEVIIDTPERYQGIVIEKLGTRGFVMKNIVHAHGAIRFTFQGPTRGLLGYRNQFMIDTKGEGIMSARVLGFYPYAGDIRKRAVGSMTSMASGKALGYALWGLQERGRLYIGPATEVYEGMVIGNTAKGEDMAVNPTKGKQLTNTRASGSDEAIALEPAWELTIERGLEIVGPDEYLEITPKSVRLRKQQLGEVERKRASKRATAA